MSAPRRGSLRTLRGLGATAPTVLATVVGRAKSARGSGRRWAWGAEPQSEQSLPCRHAASHTRRCGLLVVAQRSEQMVVCEN